MTKSSSSPSLDERIAAAFSPGPRSEKIAELIKEVEAAATSAGEKAQCARAQALDPALSAASVAIARRGMENAAFRRDRMQMAVTRLGERLRELRAQEEDQRRRVIYEKVKAVRDKLAAELKEVYPLLAHRLADLAARVAQNDLEIEQVNTRSRPNDVESLAGAELTARGLEGFVNAAGDVPRITHHLRLPGFKFDPRDSYTWPRSQKIP